MAHLIDMSNGRENYAFRGNRSDIWHGLGTQILDTDSVDDIARKAGLNWEAVKVPAMADLSAIGREVTPVQDKFFMARNDTGGVLGFCTDVYQQVQPREVIDYFRRYVGVDDRFQLDSVGSLKGGAVIFGQATFRAPMDIIGENHIARLLMTTTFDGTGATKNLGTMVRTVCWNTLSAALGTGEKALISTRHNTRFNADKVSRELSVILKGFDKYRAMAEAMIAVDLSAKQISDFFKACLDIPFDASKDDISTRKMNQFDALRDSYVATVNEGTPKGTSWAALNAVTRYVDHDRSTRGGESESEARVLSAQFGSGAQLKQKAIGLLMPDLSKLAVAA